MRNQGLLQILWTCAAIAAMPRICAAQDEAAANPPEQAQPANPTAQTKSDPAPIVAKPNDVDNVARPADPERCDAAFTYANALMRAENAYVRRKYTTVIEILRPVYANIDCLDDPNAVLEIDLLLGVAYFEQNQPNIADPFFMNVLRTEPDHIVGSVITLPESSAHRIETLRTEHAEELNKIRSELSPNTVIESLYVLAEKEEHQYWLNFVPFGAGLFQMHKTGWGIAYASIQASGIILSIVGGGMVEYYRGDNFTYTSQNYVHAKNWQNAQIVGLSILAAGYIANVIHALVVYEDSTMIIHSPSTTQPDIAQVAAPFVLPDGGGIFYRATF